jgi:hypothetical protein
VVRALGVVAFPRMVGVQFRWETADNETVPSEAGSKGGSR